MTNEHIAPVLEQLSVNFEPAIRGHLCEQMSCLVVITSEPMGIDAIDDRFSIFNTAHTPTQQLQKNTLIRLY